MCEARTYKNRVVSFIIALALAFCMGGGLWLSAFTVSVGATDEKSIETTTVAEDLANIDLSLYPYNANGNCEIISLMEYAYSEKTDYAKYFNLYIYVYNPTLKDISRADGVNTVNISTSFDLDGTLNSTSTLKLEFMSQTNDGKFLKFKLQNPTQILACAKSYAMLHEGTRRYEITGIQIKHTSDTIAKDYPVSKAYEWTGYGRNCGLNDNAISTLTCEDFGVRSIHLDIIDTYYRFKTQEDGYTQDTLNSVYFEIPVEYFNEFGSLDNITANWYEYKTQPIFVTSDKSAYTALWEWRNKVITDSSKPSWRVWWEEEYGWELNNHWRHFSSGYNVSTSDSIYEVFGTDGFSYSYEFLESAKKINCIQWLFYKDVEEINDYIVTSDELFEYCRNYKNAYPGSELILGEYSINLFEDSVDADRIAFVKNGTSGFVEMTFKAGEEFDEGQGNIFVDSDKSQSAWNKFWFGTKYEGVSYSPIVVVSEGDLVLTAKEFSDKYYVHKDDAQGFIDNAKTAYNEGRVPVLLRHAVTDYYSSEARFDYNEKGTGGLNEDISPVDGYVAQETVFLNFDVISLGFKSDDGYRDVVIGVVNNPIDIINDLTPPEDMTLKFDFDDMWSRIEELWQTLVAILLLIGVVLCINPILSILKVLWNALLLVVNILLLPFKAIGSLFKRRK